MLTLLRYLWASPNTVVGALFVPLALARGRATVVRGVIEVHGSAIAWLLSRAPIGSGGAMALTLGHVVIGQDAAALDVTREHERVHVRQYERWGPLFLPALRRCDDDRFDALATSVSRQHVRTRGVWRLSRPHG